MKLNPFAIMKEEFDGTGVVYHPESNKALTLNKSGVTIWNTLAANGDVNAAVDAILDRFDGVTREQAEADVQSFLQRLEDAGLASK